VFTFQTDCAQLEKSSAVTEYNAYRKKLHQKAHHICMVVQLQKVSVSITFFSFPPFFLPLPHLVALRKKHQLPEELTIQTFSNFISRNMSSEL
jgi:hypothetical protein